jgi:hypothetical protein
MENDTLSSIDRGQIQSGEEASRFYRAVAGVEVLVLVATAVIIGGLMFIMAAIHSTVVLHENTGKCSASSSILNAMQEQPRRG